MDGDEDGTGTGGGVDTGAGNSVRRPMNAFLIFCKRHRSLVREKNPHLDNRSVTRILGELWASLPLDEKSTYTNLAKQYKDAFMKANPDYKWYNPDKTTSHAPPPPTAGPKVSTRPTNAFTVYHGHKPTSSHNTGSITPGKLADPSNMGGLSLLLMAGTSLDSDSKPDATQATAATADGDKPGSTLLQLAEMCSSRLTDNSQASSNTDIKPLQSVPITTTSHVASSVAMTPPWTPKYEPPFSPKHEPSAKVEPKQESPKDSYELEEALPKYKKALKTLNQSKPTNQLPPSKATNGTPVFKTKAAMKTPPTAVLQMSNNSPIQSLPATSTGESPVLPQGSNVKKVYSIVASPPLNSTMIPSSTNQQSPRMQPHPMVSANQGEPLKLPTVTTAASKTSPSQNLNRHVMDRVIETFYCHEMGSPEPRQKLYPALTTTPTLLASSKLQTVPAATTIKVKLENVKPGVGVNLPHPSSMTFGQIQETLIRKAMESSYTSPIKSPIKTDTKIGQFLKVEQPSDPNIGPALQLAKTVMESKEVKSEAEQPKPNLKTPFLFPFLPTLPITPSQNVALDGVKQEIKVERPPVTTNTPQRGIKTPEGLKTPEVKEEDLTCHEKMDDTSPLTREEMEQKLLSSAEKVQAEIAAAACSSHQATLHREPPTTPVRPHDFTSPLRPAITSKPPTTPSRQRTGVSATPPKKRRKLATSESSSGEIDNVTAVINAVAANVKPAKPRKRKSTQGSSDSEGKIPNKVNKKNGSKSISKTDSSDSSLGSKTPPKVSWTRHPSFNSETSGIGGGDHSDEDCAHNGEGDGVRKSSRRNRGKRYQELISQGLIQSNRAQHRLRTDSNSEDAGGEKADKDFTPSPGTIIPSLLPNSAPVSKKRKRTVSETSYDDPMRYKTGDFDLEERIASLPPVTIENVSTSRGGKVVRRTSHPRVRHASSSSSTGGGETRAAKSATIKSEHDTHTVKSQDLTIAELQVHKQRHLSGENNTSSTSSSSTTASSNKAAPVSAPAAPAPVVTGSARRKVRRHAITRLVQMSGPANTDPVIGKAASGTVENSGDGIGVKMGGEKVDNSGQAVKNGLTQDNSNVNGDEKVENSKDETDAKQDVIEKNNNVRLSPSTHNNNNNNSDNSSLHSNTSEKENSSLDLNSNKPATSQLPAIPVKSAAGSPVAKTFGSDCHNLSALATVAAATQAGGSDEKVSEIENESKSTDMQCR